MRKRILVLCCLLILIAAYAFYHWHKRQGKETYITLYGNVDVRQVDLSFRVSGRLIEMRYDEGDLLKPGMLVATIEKDIFIENVRALEAHIAALKAQLSNALRIYERRDEIIKSGAVSEEDYETTRTQCDILRAQIQESEAQLANAKTDLVDTDLYAPVEGTILTRIREPGTIMNYSEPVCTVSILNPVWVRAYAQEPDLGRIYPGMPAKIYTDTKGGKVYEGHVGFISPLAEFTPKNVETTSLRTELVYRLRIYADNPDIGLRQGMPVTVHLTLPKTESGNLLQSSLSEEKVDGFAMKFDLGKSNIVNISKRFFKNRNIEPLEKGSSDKSPDFLRNGILYEAPKR